MKRQDFHFIILLTILFAPFFLFEELYLFYENFNKQHGVIMAFLKFSVLATMGESLGLRIREGIYLKNGFGLLPRAFVWGFLGISIQVAFVIFDSGTQKLISFLGMENVDQLMQGGISSGKIIVAFSISTFLNLFYAPVLMTVHKITDTHILNNGGTLKGLFSRIRFAHILSEMDWDTHWNFVLKKTIPFFWIPMQTITFLLPAELRVLFAALLGIALGAILAFASLKNPES